MRSVKWSRSLPLPRGRALELGVAFEWRGLMRWLPSYPVERRPALFDLIVHANVTEGVETRNTRRRYPSERDRARWAKGAAMDERPMPSEPHALRQYIDDLHEALGAVQSMDDLGTDADNAAALQLLYRLERKDADAAVRIAAMLTPGRA